MRKPFTVRVCQCQRRISAMRGTPLCIAVAHSLRWPCMMAPTGAWEGWRGKWWAWWMYSFVLKKRCIRTPYAPSPYASFLFSARPARKNWRLPRSRHALKCVIFVLYFSEIFILLSCVITKIYSRVDTELWLRKVTIPNEQVFLH